MHEYSIVASLIDLCEKQLKKSEAKYVKQVNLQIGRLSGIDSHFIKSSFDFFKEDTCCEKATLFVEDIEVQIRCNSCSLEIMLFDNNFYCPNCKSSDTKILKGQEMIVESIEVV